LRAVLVSPTGISDLTADPLPDHHNCRRGKWYDGVTDATIRNNSAFKALEDPHKRVHEAGKAILRRHHSGDTAGALTETDRLHAASHDVLACLDRLAQDMHEPAIDVRNAIAT
jgi:methyl-accepting chemotaxis protein